MSVRRTFIALLVVLIGLITVTAPAVAGRASLTNLAHLNFLLDSVAPPAQAGHTTYRMSAEPRIGVLWTYADRRDDGHYDRIGGGPYDPATNTYAQGAFNADDVSRAAVVYLRHWRQQHDPGSRQAAYQLLRGLTYLQTATGPNAGNVVLWMQPDGTLNRSPIPVELPDPSDSGASYWLARTIWALGEGYAAFRGTDPAFAAFLRERIDLAISALNRQVLSRYGQYQLVDGKRVPAWLVVDGADASAEAVLGLAAYVEVSGDAAARTALGRLSEGIAAMAGGDAGDWPYGAVLPWALSPSLWHAWASQMPAALARASQVLNRPALRHPAVTDAAVFTPHLLISGGPDNGWLPVPADRTQIAYGVDSRLQSLLAVATAADSTGLRQLAGITAGWYFGANAAGIATYDPATGRTADGVSGAGVVNRNAGAESTIHGLLSMLALDAAPDVARLARASASIVSRESTVVIEAEAGQLSGGGQVVRPPSAWTGEALWSGAAYLAVTDGATATWTLPGSDQPRLVQPVVELVPDRAAGRTGWSSESRRLGTVDHRGGAQGNSPAPGALLPVTLARLLPAGQNTLLLHARGGPSNVDAILLQPEISQVVLGGVAILHSAATGHRVRSVRLPGNGSATVSSYDRRGQLIDRRTVRGTVIAAGVAPGGFTLIQR